MVYGCFSWLNIDTRSTRSGYTEREKKTTSESLHNIIRTSSFYSLLHVECGSCGRSIGIGRQTSKLSHRIKIAVHSFFVRMRLIEYILSGVFYRIDHLSTLIDQSVRECPNRKRCDECSNKALLGYCERLPHTRFTAYARRTAIAATNIRQHFSFENNWNFIEGLKSILTIHS